MRGDLPLAASLPLCVRVNIAVSLSARAPIFSEQIEINSPWVALAKFKYKPGPSRIIHKNAK